MGKIEVRYLTSKPLADGTVAHYWAPPTKFKKRGCPYVAEALGTDEAVAVARAKILNQQLDDWRAPKASGNTCPTGTIGWLRREYEAHDKFKRLRESTRDGYSDGFDILEGYKLEKTGRLLKDVLAHKLRRRHVRKLQSDLTEQRGLATSNAVMRMGRLLWNFAMEELESDDIAKNPFRKLDLEKTGGNTYAVTRDEAYQFIAQADSMGFRSMGTAVMLSFELCQREGDVIGVIEDGEFYAGITWACYRSPKDFGARAEIQIRQSKTDKLVWMPLYRDGEELIPGLIERLEKTPRHGSLIVMRDKVDRKKKLHLPYKEDWFRHQFRAIATAAGLDPKVTFMGMRHGGLTELGDAEATDREMMSVSGHTNPMTLAVYSKRTSKQAGNAAQKRLVLRRALEATENQDAQGSAADKGQGGNRG